MNSYIQRFRYAATGRWAVSLRTYLLIFPFGYLVSIERELIFNPVTLSRAALIALAGEMASFLYLFLVQNLLLGKRTLELQPIWRCFFVWVSTGFVRGFFVSAYANWVFGYEWDLQRRLPAATSYTAVVMALAALYFGSIERRRTEFRALKSLEKVLAQEESGLLELDARHRAEAQEVLQSQLLPQVIALRNGIEKALRDGSGVGSDAAVSNLYQQSVKILNELESQRRLMEIENQITPSPVIDRTELSYWSALIPRIMSVRITVVFYVLGAVSGQFTRNGIEGVAAGLLGLVPLLVIIFPISQGIKRSSSFRPQLFIAGFIGVFFSSYFYNVVQPSLGFTLDYPYAPWYSATKTIYGLYFASVIASLLVDSGDKREAATALGTQVKEKVDHLVARNYALERAIFAGRFGTLQGKLSGVTMALHLIGSESMDSISKSRKMELLSDANSLLGESLDEIEILKVEAL